MTAYASSANSDHLIALTIAMKQKKFVGSCADSATRASGCSATIKNSSQERCATSPSTTSEPTHDLPHDIRAAGSEVIRHYRKLIRDGQTPRFAEMCALQQAPATHGMDRTFMHGRHNQQWLDDMPKHQAERILREAKAAGISTSGKFYMSGIADKRGHCDPAAWIDSTAEIKKVAKQRNLTVSGIVNCKGEPQPPPQQKLSKQLERQYVRREMSENPKLTRAQAKEKVLSEYVPRWKK